jgi:hypothetical protein
LKRSFAAAELATGISGHPTAPWAETLQLDDLIALTRERYPKGWTQAGARLKLTTSL